MSRVCQSCGFDAEFVVAICPSCRARMVPTETATDRDSHWEKTVVRAEQVPDGTRRRPRFDRTDEFYEPLQQHGSPEPVGSGLPVSEPEATMITPSARSADDATVVLRNSLSDPAPPLGYLVERSGPRVGTAHLLGKETVIGRGSDADLVLAGNAVSKRHARVRVEDGLFVFWDLASTNSSHLVGLDGTRTRIVEPHVLVDGDTFDLGDIRVTFLMVAEGASA